MSASEGIGVRPSSNAIPINSLSVAELQGLREKVDAEVQRLSSSKIQLQRVLAAFSVSDGAISKLSNANPGDEMLLPLTGSLYVSGRATTVDSVLLDIGTGYFVEQSVAEATDYCKRKATYLTQNIQEVNQVLIEKQKALRTISHVLDSKMQQEST